MSLPDIFICDSVSVIKMHHAMNVSVYIVLLITVTISNPGCHATLITHVTQNTNGKTNSNYILNTSDGENYITKENIAISFQGTSSVEITGSDGAPRGNRYRLEFFFRTTLSKCALVIVHEKSRTALPFILELLFKQNRAFFLGISDGRLSLWSPNTEPITVGNYISDAGWHKVVVELNTSHILLSSDTEQVSSHTSALQNFPNLSAESLITHLGGFKSELLEEWDPFVGCMRSVILNGHDIMEKVTDYQITFTNTINGCARTDQCNPSPCQNGGNCTDLWDEYRCTCPPSHIGETCQIPYSAAVFNSDDLQSSLITVDIPAERKVWNTFEISMVIQTTRDQGTVFYLGDKELGASGNYIEVSINHGEIWVTKYMVHPIPSLQRNGGGFVSDGKPHLIIVRRHKTDGRYKALNATVLYIGGKPANIFDRNGNSAADYRDEDSQIFIPEPYQFRGSIRDVIVDLCRLNRFAECDNYAEGVYFVDAFNRSENGRPLGILAIQNLQEKTVSDGMKIKEHVLPI